MQIEIPGIELSSDTVVGNILYEPSTLMSMAALLVMLLMMIWDKGETINKAKDK